MNRKSVTSILKL